MSIRIERIEKALKKEISMILQEDLKDPRIGFITITEVEVTKDLKEAKVYYTIFGREKSKKDTAIGLTQASGYIRSLIASRMDFRSVPHFSFVYDDSSNRGGRINEILEKLEQEKQKREKEKQ